MNDTTSKNIIIALLVGIVLGLLAIIFGVGEGSEQQDQDPVSELGESQSETDTRSISSENQPQTSTEATAVPTSSKTVTTQSTQSAVPVQEYDKTVVIVTYTSSGFIPPVVEVEAGGSVSFINSSNKPLWVTSENHPTAKGQVYRGFDQGKSVSSGGIYTFAFTQVGVWGYKNLNAEEHLGAISVIAQ